MNSELLDKEQTIQPFNLRYAGHGQGVLVGTGRRSSPRADSSPPDFRLHPLGSPVVPPILRPLSSPPLALDLVPLQTQLPARMPKFSPLGSQPLAFSLRQLDRDSYEVLMSPPHGAAKPVVLEVPVGLPRVINVATLKAMFGAGSNDLVFRKTEGRERWEVCPDDYVVDLEDRTQVLKIREWAILS